MEWSDYVYIFLKLVFCCWCKQNASPLLLPPNESIIINQNGIWLGDRNRSCCTQETMPSRMPFRRQLLSFSFAISPLCVTPVSRLLYLGERETWFASSLIRRLSVSLPPSFFLSTQHPARNYQLEIDDHRILLLLRMEITVKYMWMAGKCRIYLVWSNLASSEMISNLTKERKKPFFNNFFNRSTAGRGICFSFCVCVCALKSRIEDLIVWLKKKLRSELSPCIPLQLKR